jgi:hypothetical protein
MPYVFENKEDFVFEESGSRFVFEEPEDRKTTTAGQESANLLERAKAIGQTGNIPRPEIETLKQIAKGYPALETAAHLTTMSYGLPAAGIAALIAGTASGPKFDSEAAMKAMEKVSNTLIYQPKTEEGQKLTESTMYPIEKLEEGAGYAGEKTLEKTGSPALATAVHTGIMAAPLAIPMLRNALKKGKTTPLKTKPAEQAATEFLQKEFKDRFIIEEPITKDVPKKVTIGDNIVEQTKGLPIEKTKVTGKELKDRYVAESMKGDTVSTGMGMPQKRVKSDFEIEAGKLYEGKTTKDLMEKEYNLYIGKGKNKQIVKTVEEINEVNGTKFTKDTWNVELEKFSKQASDLIDKAFDDYANKINIKESGKTLYSGLPIPEITNVYKKATDKIWDVGIEQKLPQLLEKIPGGKAINRALIYDYRADLKNPGKYIKSMEDKIRAQQIGKMYALDLGTRLERFPEKGKMQLGEYIRGELDTLPKELLSVADEAKLSMFDLGKQAVDVGLLKEETFFRNVGRYMARLYTSKEHNGLLKQFNLTKPNRLDLSRFQKRKDIPKELREEMGEILTPGYPIAKGITQLTHDIEQARWFKNIAANKDWAMPKGTEGILPDGWKELPNNRKLGSLSEAKVHPEIFGDITESIRMIETPEKVWRKALGAWKFGKVILSPKTHARNVMSNSILAHLGGMPMYEQPIYLTKSIQAMRGKNNYWKDATSEGLLGSTWTQHELSALFEGVEGNLKGLKAGGIPEQFGIIGSGFDKAKGSMNKAAKLYQAEEEWFKLAKYIHNIERKGMDKITAAKDAEKWLFNYGKVTKFQEAYRSKWYGAPFATFTIKALPRIAEAAVKTPHRFILPGAMIYGLEQAAMKMIGDSPEQAKAKKELAPEWMKGNFLGMPNFARVPITDDSGREYYLNLTYILPWGDIGESGGFAGIPGSLMPMSQPFVKETWQQIANYDSFWEQPIVAKEDLAGKDLAGKIKTQAEKRGQHLLQTMAPTPVLDIQKGAAALKGKPDYRGRERPSGAVLADAVFGVKVYPVDYIDQMVRRVNELDPRKGFMARKIKGQINTLEIKRKAMEKKGKPTEFYKKAIESKINQLKGLGAELSKIGDTYKKTKSDNRWIIE